MRGAETILEIVEVGKDWDGNPTGDEPDPRPIDGCQWIPILSPEDGVTVLNGGQVFVPPDQTPPAVTSQLEIRGDRYMIDGNIAQYDMRLNAKGALFKVVRVQ